MTEEELKKLEQEVYHDLENYDGTGTADINNHLDFERACKLLKWTDEMLRKLATSHAKVREEFPAEVQEFKAIREVLASHIREYIYRREDNEDAAREYFRYAEVFHNSYFFCTKD